MDTGDTIAINQQVSIIIIEQYQPRTQVSIQ